MGRRWKVGLIAAVLATFGWGFLELGSPDATSAEQPRRTATTLRHDQARNEGVAIAPESRAMTTPPREFDTARDLFSFAAPLNADALTSALPAPTREIHYVRLNQAMITGKQSPFWQSGGRGIVVVPLAGGETLAVAIDRSEMLGSRRFVSEGRILGRPASRAVFAYTDGHLHATIHDPELGNFALRSATEEFSQFYQTDEALFPACGLRIKPSAVQRAAAVAASRRAASPISPGAAASGQGPHTAAAEADRVEVHVLIAYTRAVLPTMSGSARTAALQSAFDAEIARVNAMFVTSNISARVRLVGLAETSYPGEATSPSMAVQDEALTALQADGDGKMDELHALRDAVGADLVCLVLNRLGESAGLGFLLGDPADPVNGAFAFSVVQYGILAGGTTLAHEFGHNFGCDHDRDAAAVEPPAFPYSYGYKFRASNGVLYRDVMAYPPGLQLHYFGNPAIAAPPPAPSGSPGGVPRGQTGECDTAMTIEQTAFAASSYRLQQVAPANAGTLVNVATRAFVGTGDQVLIGGFVVGGAQPKQILIRASGPALRAFGVTDALADPAIQVYSGSSAIAVNDNWSAQIPRAGTIHGTSAEIAAAFATTRAFNFVDGSADAALLLTLNPGLYTAVVGGAGGATGSGLIEAYEVDRTGGKIVNLSTRGYADRGREMFGGFVIQGEPGSTKRVLIRVLGPSLARPPFNVNTVLDDPLMELRDARGALLIANDDWSADSFREGGMNDDFRPTVEYYNERQISATGFAPGNRREPCILVDLVPGNYTVVVRPFELRHADPLRDQPAIPGVGIIEVYEINP